MPFPLLSTLLLLLLATASLAAASPSPSVAAPYHPPPLSLRDADGRRPRDAFAGRGRLIVWSDPEPWYQRPKLQLQAPELIDDVMGCLDDEMRWRPGGRGCGVFTAHLNGIWASVRSRAGPCTKTWSEQRPVFRCGKDVKEWAFQTHGNKLNEWTFAAWHLLPGVKYDVSANPAKVGDRPLEIRWVAE
ncbi:MAG: hypothetical protein M1826_003666 [Phylliscum demangeonii]|nr:MAG: hypothetical protein M1826_003666 [Phylliscum demangeonii]